MKQLTQNLKSGELALKDAAVPRGYRNVGLVLGIDYNGRRVELAGRRR